MLPARLTPTLVLSAALAAITLAASAPAVEERPAQVAADRMPAARIADHGDAGDQTGGALGCCMR
jgi:hypothetical protein